MLKPCKQQAFAGHFLFAVVFKLRKPYWKGSKPFYDAVKKMAAKLDTTVGYLLGESTKGKTLKDTAMLQRLNDIASFPDEDKKHILYTIDGLIMSAKVQTL